MIELQLTEKAKEIADNLQLWLSMGWTEELLLEHGFATHVEPEKIVIRCGVKPISIGEMLHSMFGEEEEDSLENKIAQWHHDRNLIDGSTDKDQFHKLIQECGELSDNLCQGKDIKDDIGDIIVVLINIATRNNLDLSECMQVAYDDIKDRKGQMIDGVFVKESDLQSVDNTRYIYGDARCGKTHHSKALADYFGCTNIIDNWDGSTIVPPCSLVLLTNGHFNFDIKQLHDSTGKSVMNFETAMKLANIKSTL